MIRTAGDDEKLMGDPRKTEFTISAYEDTTSFLYGSPSELKLVFAFTSSSDLSISRHLADLPQIKLGRADESFLEAILEKLWGVYQRAYGERAASMDRDHYLALLRGHTFDNTRAIVKGAVEALDVVRFGTDESDDVD